MIAVSEETKVDPRQRFERVRLEGGGSCIYLQGVHMHCVGFQIGVVAQTSYIHYMPLGARIFRLGGLLSAGF